MDSKKVTILSIDGGGVHGVVPAVLLEQLEQYLKEEREREGEENVNVRLAEYFDVIAGTGIGSLIACMLCKPEPSNMSEILSTLEDISKRAFPDDYEKGYFERVKWSFYAGLDLVTSSIVNIARGTPFRTVERYWERSWEEQRSPIQQFRLKLDECLGDARLDQTLTNLIVPAYHFDKAQPMVFSSHIYSQDEIDDFGEVVSLKDVVLGSSATPTVFPFHEIKDKHYKELTGKFADGSIVANNPSMLAVEEAAMIFGSEEKFKNYMVLSLGTVRRQLSSQLFGSFDNALGIAREIFNKLTSFNIWTDIVAGCLQYMYIFFNAMTELYMSRLFPTQTNTRLSSNYLRLQAYVELKNEVPSILNGSKKAFDKLKRIAKIDILKQKAVVVHPNRGARHKQKFTNQDALREFAKRLHEQKKIKDEEENN